MFFLLSYFVSNEIFSRFLFFFFLFFSMIFFNVLLLLEDHDLFSWSNYNFSLLFLSFSVQQTITHCSPFCTFDNWWSFFFSLNSHLTVFCVVARLPLASVKQRHFLFAKEFRIHIKTNNKRLFFLSRSLSKCNWQKYESTTMEAENQSRLNNKFDDSFHEININESDREKISLFQIRKFIGKKR